MREWTNLTPLLIVLGVLAASALLFGMLSLAGKFFDFQQANPAKARRIFVTIAVALSVLRLGLVAIRAFTKPPAQNWQMSAAVQLKLVRRIDPIYPPLAARARVEGIVRLSALISPNGAVQELKLIEGNPLLAPAAMKAVSQWLYSPPIIQGKALSARTEIDVNFHLTSADEKAK